jgi:dethiobiotin synthetase/adenosylmethionine--8-amino-7-oxononanoate aminotransferase
VTGGLLRTRTVHLSQPTLYIKPIQCGRPSDEDFIKKYTTADTLTLVDFPEFPCSPHLASFATARLPSSPYPLGVPDDVVTSKLGSALSSSASSSTIFVETAGGVLSPSTSFASPPSTPSPPSTHIRHKDSDHYYTTQANLYRNLHLPVILVADSRLGGVSCTLTAIESLSSRGYDLDAVIFMKGEKSPLLDNAGCVRDYLKGTSSSTTVHEIPNPPPMPSDLFDYYDAPENIDIYKAIDDSLR